MALLTRSRLAQSKLRTCRFTFASFSTITFRLMVILGFRWCRSFWLRSITEREDVAVAAEPDRSGRDLDHCATSGKFSGTPVRSRLTTAPFEVPLRTTSSGFLSGEVGLDGFEKNVNFIIDTAASITVVSEKLSQEEQLLDLLQPSKMRVFGAAGVTEDVKLLQLPRLSLGLSKLEKINAAVLDMEPVNETAGFTQSGILGGNFLRHFRIYFDFARGAMRLEPLNQKPKSVENINPEVVSTP